MKNIIILLAPLVALFISSCGSTSSITNQSGKVITSSVAKYTKVVVGNFKLVDPEIHPETKSLADASPELFSTYIVNELKKTGKFSSVTRRSSPSGNALFINGEITEYDDGNAALRLFIGMGAGSSKFNATVNYSAGLPAKKLGSVDVDKSSYVLGGSLAATQKAASYMPGAAKKVASEAVKFAISQ